MRSRPIQSCDDLLDHITPEGMFHAEDVFTLFEAIDKLEGQAWNDSRWTSDKYQGYKINYAIEVAERSAAVAGVLCEVLGDQSHLWSQIDYLREYILHINGRTNDNQDEHPQTGG